MPIFVFMNIIKLGSHSVLKWKQLYKNFMLELEQRMKIIYLKIDTTGKHSLRNTKDFIVRTLP